MRLVFAGFDWDDGNAAKCLKHGVTAEEIESLFRLAPRIAPDMKHSDTEERFIAVGRGAKGRLMFVAFAIRDKGGEKLIRPISARYMHKKENDKYEETENS